MSWLSRETGISTSTLSDYMRGVTPRADKAIVIAKALKTSVEWLFQGSAVASPRHQLMAADDVVWAVLPRFELAEFSAEAKPEQIGRVPLPRQWLNTIGEGVDDLWVTSAPSNVGNMLVEGEEIICADLKGPLIDGRVYVFRLDEHQVIRRVIVTANGYDLVTGDPATPALTVPRDYAEQGPFPVARVVGKFRFNPM